MEYRVFVILAPIAAASVVVTALQIFRYRKLRISRTILAYLGSVALLLVTNTLELVTESEYWTLIFTRTLHVAWHCVVVSWFAFSAVYAGREHLTSPRSVSLLLAFPLLEAIIINTGIGDQWFYRSIDYLDIGGFVTLHASYGFLFWVNGVYIYSLLGIGIIMIVRTALDQPNWFQRQTVLLVAGAFFPIIMNLVYVFRLFPLIRKDFTSIAFAFSGLAFYFGVQRYRLLGRRPISRSIILEDVHSAVIVLSPDRTVLDANPAARELIDSVVGEETIVDVLLAGIPIGQHFSFETSTTSLSGDIRTFDVTIRPIIERTGVQMATVVTITETTAWIRLKQFNQEIHLRMLEQERLATLGLISASIAHEVKNPLTILQSAFYATINLARERSEHEYDSHEAIESALEEYTESFRRGFNRIITVLQTMATHVRGESGEEKAPTDLHELIKNTLQLTRSAYRDIAEVEEAFGTIPLVPCMPGSISQVLLNIVLNAIQSIESSVSRDILRPRSSGELDRIYIETTKTSANSVRCTILNSGPPIPTEIRGQIFDPFFTTKPHGEGTGLGLSISRDIIERYHGGTIVVVDRDGMTGIAIELPIDPEYG